MAAEDGGGSAAALGNGALLVAAGLADLALDGAGAALRGLRGLLGRSDLAELAQDGHEELTARGRLAVQRYASPSEPHLELLARRVAAGTGPGGSDAARDEACDD